MYQESLRSLSILKEQITEDKTLKLCLKLTAPASDVRLLPV